VAEIEHCCGYSAPDHANFSGGGNDIAMWEFREKVQQEGMIERQTLAPTGDGQPSEFTPWGHSPFAVGKFAGQRALQTKQSPIGGWKSGIYRERHPRMTIEIRSP